MKRIIDHVTYNTNTASFEGVWWGDGESWKLGFWSEELHVTRAGKYFLRVTIRVGPGYARPWKYGRKEYYEFILPLTKVEAKEWLATCALWRSGKAKASPWSGRKH